MTPIHSSSQYQQWNVRVKKTKAGLCIVMAHVRNVIGSFKIEHADV
jgi:hypothetical protein